MGLRDLIRAFVSPTSPPPPAPPSPPVAAQQPPQPQPAEPAPRAQDPLIRELTAAAVPADLTQLVISHRKWLADTLPQHRQNVPYREHLRQEEVLVERLKTADDDQLRATATLALARLHNATSSLYLNVAVTAFQRLSRRKMNWTAEQVGWLLRCPIDVPHLDGRVARDRITELAQLGVTAAERVSPDGQALLAEDLTKLLAALETSTAAGAKLAGRINALLQPTGTADPTALPAQVLPDDDRYGHLARAALAERHKPELIVATVTHLSRYSGSVTAGKGWRTKTVELLAAQPATADVAATMLSVLLTHRDYTKEREYIGHTFVEPFFVDQGTTQLLRAAVWMVALAPNASDRLALLGDVAVHCGIGFGGSGASSRLSPVTTSAVAALSGLAETATDAATVVGQLARVQTKVSNKPIRKAVDAALDRAAAAAGMTAGELLEQAVPDFGLDADGAAEVPVGAHTALLTLAGGTGTGTGGAKLTIRWRTPTGRVVAAVPAQVKAEHPEQLTELRTRAKEAKTAVSVQRTRVEELLSTGRTWSGSDWRARYAEHPVVGLTARALLWRVRKPATEATAGSATGLDEEQPWFSGLPEQDGDRWLLRRHDGTEAQVDSDSDVRLWHPLEQPLAEVQAWRAQLSDRSFRQPFKQAFREIYLLTPAEVGTGTYSNRFAAHILRYPQAGALMRTRGWNGAHLGYWDGGQDGQATKEFEGGWRVAFYYSLVERDADNYAEVSLCSTDQVRFERYDGHRDGGGWNPRPLAEVPALILSEAMRDVDLFVGVTSVAADPEWADRGTARLQTYWQRESFGDLGESAKMRREALDRLLPRTKLAGRTELTDRFLVVHGHLRDYKIHLGSGNILMSPADTYLCIVPARDGSTPKKVYLPFEEDGGKLAVILSKAFLLAEDTAITDTSITRQLRLGL